MDDPTTRTHLRWRSELGRFGIREAIALLAVVVIVVAAVAAGLEAAGFDTVAWIRDSLGMAS